MIAMKGLEKALSQVDAYTRNQVPFAASLALNTVALQARETVRSAMPSIFKNPTPYTLNSMYVKPSTKRALVAYVGLIEDPGKGGTPAAKYLAPEITGGTRGKKFSEKQLGNRQNGGGDISGSGSVWWVPGERKADYYGNMPGGQVNRILTALNVQSVVPGHFSTKTAKSVKRNPVMDKIFMVTAKDHESGYGINDRRNHLPPGVYQRTGTKRNRHVIPLLVFQKHAPVYKKRFRFHEMVRAVVTKNFKGAFRDAMRKAMSPGQEWHAPHL